MMNSITVCVEYDDFLQITLPRNLRHFTDTLVVTSPEDQKTQALTKYLGCKCLVTDVFYRDGASFNKGAAMEEGFDYLGREGWICVWDADIVMPVEWSFNRNPSCLYSPARRILEDPTLFTDDLDWKTLRNSTNINEFAGYFQLFHSSALKKLPWYGTDWTHAGGCDSDFEQKFSMGNKCRTSFDVLHLGPEGIEYLNTRIGADWSGRVTRRIDGGIDSTQKDIRQKTTLSIITNRDDDMTREKIHPTDETQQQNVIPRRMSFFWTGPMSWMRYLTLYTFRLHNPTWQIYLYEPNSECIDKDWKEYQQPQAEDNRHYDGVDYSHMLSELNIVRRSIDMVEGLSPAQACDIFQWELLAGEGGFYADMDILWMNSLDEVYEDIKDDDVVFCLENVVLAIGFMASKSKCDLFQKIVCEALDRCETHVNKYQGYGTDLLYDVAFDGMGRHGCDIGIQALNAFRKKHPSLNIVSVPDEVVYPFDWTEPTIIFNQELPAPKDSVGIHWFGGAPISQEWNKKLTEKTWEEYSSTFTNCLRFALRK